MHTEMKTEIKTEAKSEESPIITNSFYSKIIKRFIDIILSGLAIIGLSPLLLFLAIWIKLDSPGPVFFKQKRVGQDKVLFNILKFRTMRTDAPHDVPTHLLGNPESYITRSGKLLRRTSLDELPQIFNIFIGQMSIIGPRPALWNQDDLIAERDKYGVNGIVPGLTGWAQVNGRDELEIDVKARIDGEYARNIKFSMDWTCFWMTVGNVLKRKGVVEGGTGVMAKQKIKRENEVRAEAGIDAEASAQHQIDKSGKATNPEIAVMKESVPK